MLYFKSIVLETHDGQAVENAIRQFSAKRHTSLDLQSSASYISDHKVFLGLENDTNIRITRVRSPFERFLPKLIVRFDKADGFNCYRIRLSLLPNLMFLFLTIAIILNVIGSLTNGRLESDLPSILALYLTFVALILLEITLTKRRLSAILKLSAQTGNTGVPEVF